MVFRAYKCLRADSNSPGGGRDLIRLLFSRLWGVGGVLKGAMQGVVLTGWRDEGGH